MIMIIAPMVLIGMAALGILNDAGLVDYGSNTLLLLLLLLQPVLMMEMLMEELF